MFQAAQITHLISNKNRRILGQVVQHLKVANASAG